MGKLPGIFIGVFGVVGVGLLIGAFFATNATLSFRADALTAPGRVIGIDGGKPVVEFDDQEGRTRRVVGSVSSKPPAYDVGEHVMVQYQPGEFGEARIDGFLENWFASLLLGGLGSVFTGFGVGFGIWQIKKRRLHAWLRQFGIQVQAKYTGTRLDTSVRVNRRNPWRITAQWQNPADGAVHTFESEMIFYDPSDYVQREQIDVWIDPSDPSRYLVDTAFLPRHADS